MSKVDYGPDAIRWAARLATWTRQRNLHGAVGALLDAVEPLGPLGAQIIWVAQPALSVFVPRGEIDALARLVEAPGGVAWLREQIAGHAPGDHLAGDTSDTIGDETQ